MKNFSSPLKYFIAFVPVIMLLFASCNQAPKTANEETAAADSSDYKLAWSDEFNGNAVDTNNWVYDLGGEGWGNHEQEYYQPANATIENGELVITAKKETVGTNHYTSTRLKSQGRQEFLYGKIEARIKIPVGQGIWPAFWMLGANIDSVGWPKCSETDIMEHINTDSLLFGTPHWDDSGHIMKGDTIAYTPSEYHLYGIEWDSASIRWYLDGKQFHELDISNSINSTEEFHKPSFLLLNLAIGGDWPGQTIDDTKIPAKMYVDYVRVYKK